MSGIRKVIIPILGLTLAIQFSGCGIASYPGQPGVETNGYSKIDMENLDFDGLWVYEVVYDNTESGKGVGAIVTKLYPGAQTYTTNVRTNGEGTLYRHKGQLNGAEVQMISIPSLNQIHLSPNSKVGLLLGFSQSLDEVDDINKAESDLFKPQLMAKVSRALQLKWQLLKLGKFTGRGLSYEVSAVKLGEKKLSLAAPVIVETTLTQNGVRAIVSAEQREEITRFVESNFPKGYKGKADIFFAGATEPISVSLGVNTIKTAEAAGVKIIRNASDALALEVAARFNKGNL